MGEGARSGDAAALYGLGSRTLERADNVQASSLLTASLTLRQELGDIEGIAWSLAGLALANVAHDAAHADALFSESIARFKALRDTHGIAVTTRRAAEAALGQQDTTRAAVLFMPNRPVNICSNSFVQSAATGLLAKRSKLLLRNASWFLE